MQGDTPAAASIWAARAALLALRSKADVFPTPDEINYSLASAGESLALPEAIRALAEMQKPLECDAAKEGKKVILKCAPIVEESVRIELDRIAHRFSKDWVDDIRETCGNPDPLVILASRQEALVIPFSGVNAFMHEYKLSRSLAWQPIEPELLPEGVCALLLIGPSDKDARIRIRSSDSKGQVGS